MSLVETDAPLGFQYVPDFVTSQEEASLIEELRQLDWDGRGLFTRRGQIVRRREVCFLHDYVRDRRVVSPGPPLPAFLEPLRKRCAEFVGIPPSLIQQVIAALYR